MILLDKKIKEKIESIAIHYSEPKQIAKSIEEFAFEECYSLKTAIIES